MTLGDLVNKVVIRDRVPRVAPPYRGRALSKQQVVMPRPELGVVLEAGGAATFGGPRGSWRGRRGGRLAAAAGVVAAQRLPWIW